MSCGSPPSAVRALPITSSRLPGSSVLKPPPAKNRFWEKASHCFGSGAVSNSTSESWKWARKSSWATSPPPVPARPPLPRQQPLGRQPVERGENQSLGQVSGRPEEDEDGRTGI